MSILRMGTYNILIPRTDKAVDEARSWSNRRELVKNTLVENFDLIGVQEALAFPSPNQAQELASDLFSEGFSGYLPWEDSACPDEFAARLPIFWRSELFTLENSGQVHLSGFTSEEKSRFPSLEDRYCSYVDLRVRENSTLFRFYTLHLQHARANAGYDEMLTARFKRAQAEKRLAEHLLRTAPELSVVIAGDFNTPKSLNILHELAAVRPAAPLAKTHHNLERDSFHGWKDSRISEERTPHHIDKLLVRKVAGLESASLLLTQGSDHYPVQGCFTTDSFQR